MSRFIIIYLTVLIIFVSFGQPGTALSSENVPAIVEEYLNFLQNENGEEKLRVPDLRTEWINRFEKSISGTSKNDLWKYSTLSELYVMNGNYNEAFALNSKIANDVNANSDLRLKSAHKQLELSQRVTSDPKKVLASFNQFNNIVKDFKTQNIAIDSFYDWFYLSSDYHQAMYLMTSAENALLQPDKKNADVQYLSYMEQAKDLLKKYLKEYDIQKSPYKEYDKLLEEVDFGRSATMGQIVNIAGRLKSVYAKKEISEKVKSSSEDINKYAMEFLSIFPKDQRRSGVIGRELLKNNINDLSPNEYVEFAEMVMDSVYSTQGFVDLELHRTIEEWSGSAETVKYSNMLLNDYIERYKQWYPDKYMALDQYHWYHIALARNYLDFNEYEKFNKIIKEIEKFSLSQNYEKIAGNFIKNAVEKQFGKIETGTEVLENMDDNEKNIKIENLIFIPLLSKAYPKSNPCVYDFKIKQLLFIKNESGNIIEIPIGCIAWDGVFLVQRDSVIELTEESSDSEIKINQSEKDRNVQYGLPKDVELPIEMKIKTTEENTYPFKVLKIDDKGIYLEIILPENLSIDASQ